MAFTHTFLRVANQRFFRGAVRWANAHLRPRKPMAIRVEGQVVYAATLDRIVALWMRRLTSAERFEAKLWNDLVRPGMVVADVGANLGVYSLLAARRAGPGGRVHAFEPDPENAALLRQNVTANGYGNVTIHPRAVADQVGTLTLFVRPEHRGDHRIYDTDGSGRQRIEVPVTTLDAVFADAPRLDVIKFDIQGAEGRAVAGMTSLLARFRRLTILTEYWPDGLTAAGSDPVRLLSFWRERGFRVQNIDDDRARLDELSDEAILALCRKIRYTNLLLTRE